MKLTLSTIQKLGISQRISILSDTIKRANNTFSSDPLNLSHIDVNPCNPNLVRGFKNYPPDYRMFLEKIGSIMVCTDGYAALVTCLPILLENGKEYFDEHEHYIPLWGIDDINVPKSHVAVASYPCGYDAIGYDISESPYELVSLGVYDQGDSFLEFVEFEFAENPTLSTFYLDK
ncbi:hypothetical protein N9F68_00040 [Akkermansiaceae bacterium]|nr:hypothetical protein [Akkermansiaceae bacterium]